MRRRAVYSGGDEPMDRDTEEGDAEKSSFSP
jgi:hypothetical protein